MNTIKSIQKERQSVYGNYDVNVKARSQILEILKEVNRSKGSEFSRIELFEAWMGDVVSKLVRVAASPDHEDSLVDLMSYVDLWLNCVIKKEDN